MIAAIILLITAAILFIMIISYTFELKGHPKSKFIKAKAKLEDSRKLLLNDINQAKLSIHMILRHFYPQLFNSAIIEAFEKASARGVDISIISGPVKDKNNEESIKKYLDLDNEGIISLYIKNSAPLLNFRVVDVNTVHIDKGNISETENSVYLRFENNRFQALEYERKFSNYLKK